MATQYDTDDTTSTIDHSIIPGVNIATSRADHASRLIEPDSFAHNVANNTTLATLALPVLGGEAPESVSIVSGSTVIFSVTLSSTNAVLKMLDNATCIAGTYNLTLRAVYMDGSDWRDLHVKLTAS